MNRLRNVFRSHYDNKLAINEEGEFVLYRHVCDFSEQLDCIDKQKALVFCLSDNCFGSLIGYLSFLSTGWVPLMLDKGIDRTLLHGLIQQYSPRYFWIPTEQSSNFENCSEVANAHGYSLLKLSDSNPLEINDQLALLLTTSGSTGSPKLVRISYDNIIANANSIAQYLNITRDDRPITTLPMYYSYGLSVIHSHIIHGATVLLTNRSLMEKEFWNFLKGGEATSFAGVPYTFEMLHRLRFERMNLPHLETITQAGGTLNSKLVEYFASSCSSKGQRFFVMYGQTEATARMSYLPSECATLKPASIGVSIPQGAFFLVNDNGQEIQQANVSGELVYKGPNVSMGYAESLEDLAKGDVNGGTLYTGDIALRDEEGFYYIVGRKKRFIKIFGNRVSLDATEQLLKEVVNEVACVGVDDKMLIFTTDSSKREEVRTFVSSKTGIHFSAFQVEVIDEIPQSSSGKILYSQLQM